LWRSKRIENAGIAESHSFSAYLKPKSALFCVNIVTEDDFRQTYRCQSFADKAIEKYSDLFPVRPSIELAEICADLLTDGHIQTRRHYHSQRYVYVGYFADDPGELGRFYKRVYDLFGVRGTIRKWGIRYNGASTGYILPNATVARILTLCGVPAGDKATKMYSVPEWILRGPKSLKAAFLRRSFTCEGTVYYDTWKDVWRIRYTMYKTAELNNNLRMYLGQLSEMLAEFDIGVAGPWNADRYTRKRDHNKIIGLGIEVRPGSFSRFAERIGFELRYKNELLQKACEAS